MTVRERIIAIRLSEFIHRQPKYANHIGVSMDEIDGQRKQVQIYRGNDKEKGN